MNILKLTFCSIPDHDMGKANTLVLSMLLTVDSQRLSDKEEFDMLHLDELVGSIYGYGPFEIYTCGCGTAQCAGIWEDITVDQVGDNVLWNVPNPLITFIEGSTYDHFVFDRQQYRQAIHDGLDEAKSMILQHGGSCRVGPYGFTAGQLLQLTTIEPDAVIDRRPQPRHAHVCHGPVFVENRYIARVVKEEIAGRGSSHMWVEAWTGIHWTRETIPSIPMDTVYASKLAPVELLAEAGVPEEPFPFDYELPPLANNRSGIL
ncbi:MAG TPA: hypothetical protein DEQ20_00860 [Desulfobulbaceae bacterium]|nr:hypothetical protein [Desulfobulbaceae bacterium]